LEVSVGDIIRKSGEVLRKKTRMLYWFWEILIHVWQPTWPSDFTFPYFIWRLGTDVFDLNVPEEN